MAQSFLVFDFGADEELAQQARHRLEGWKQAFRLDRKVMVEFDRVATVEDGDPTGGKKSKKKEEKEEEKGKETIQVLVRLDFSDHEKLSHIRWLERIPAEVPFKGAHPKVIRQGESEFEATSKRFDGLTSLHGSGRSPRQSPRG
jgi:hypothetical protein